MSIILLQTYAGLSMFTFETTCTGRELEEPELRARGLITDDLLRRTKDSDYASQWFEVGPGDWIRIVRRDDDVESDETYAVEGELPDPPQKLDDVYRTGMRVRDYVAKHCKRL